MVKSLLPLLKSLNISPAPTGDSSNNQPKKLGRPKKVKPPSPRIDWRHGFSAEIWLADRLHTYIHDQEKNELRVYMHMEGQYPKKALGVWRFKKHTTYCTCRGSVNKLVAYQLTQLN
jgi:hypothetical protein